ncbi:MAG TPA: HEAT repeat domain-containing protein [Acidimicrobiia bacterium]|nr:HEAT repeat domain-containing protein [Acidimicrobiia bacterium]
MDADRGPGRSGLERAADAAALGLRARLPAEAPAELERAARDDPDARVRAAALGALVRAGGRRRATTAWRAALTDPAAGVRRRAADLAPVLDSPARPLLALLADDDVTVIEAAAWALGELGPTAVGAGAVPALSTVVRGHDDPLAREAAVAALGALADPAGLPAVLAACGDKPAVRRRAVLALAPFDGPEVDAALHTALEDRDWQVRQAAEDLLAD